MGVAGSWVLFQKGTPHHEEETVELRYIIIKSPELAANEEVISEHQKAAKKVVKEVKVSKTPRKNVIVQPEMPINKENSKEDKVVEKEVFQEKEKQKAYLEYYNLVREKIRARMDSRVNRRFEGSVKTIFTVGPDGHIITVNELISSEGLSAGKRMEECAVSGIKRSGPFPPFPPEIGSNPITFSLDIRFTGSE